MAPLRSGGSFARSLAKVAGEQAARLSLIRLTATSREITL
jgi:hypothetical protein